MADGPEKLTGKKLERGVPETVEINLNGETVQMGPENYTEILQQIKETIRPGMPIYIETIERGSGILATPYTVGNVILTDGTMDEHNRFNMLWGKHSSASARLNGDDLRIFGHRNGSSFDEGISIPKEWSDEYWNEGTFNRHGHVDTTYGASGTNKVIIGGNLGDILTEAIAGIEFVKDAVSVNTPQFYGIETYSIVRQGDGRRAKSNDIIRTMAQENAETKEARLIDLLSFTLKMVEQATKKLDKDYWQQGTIEQQLKHKDFAESLRIQEVCTFLDAKDGFDENGYHFAPYDFIVYEPGSQRRNIGYLKTNTGFHGHGFFLPARGMKRVANLAFDPDFIKQFYPKA